MDKQGTGSESAVRNERFFYGWFIVGILFFISIIDGGFTYIFSAFLKPLSEEFGWSRAQTSFALSLYLLVAGLVLPLWGWLVDRIGVRIVYLVSALIDGVALLLLSYVQSLAAFYILYLFLGIGLAGIGPMSVGKVVTQWFVAKRGRAMGIALVGAGMGGLVLVPVAGFLIAEFSWRTAYQLLALLSLGGMLPLVWFFLTDTPEEKGLVPLGQESLSENSAAETEEIILAPGDWTLKEALHTSTFWLLGAAFCLGILATSAIVAHQVALLQDAGMTLGLASTIAGVVLGVTMGGRFLVGWISERIPHPHYILFFCLVIQAVGVGMLLGLSSLGFWVLAIFVPLFGLGYGGLIVLWPLVVSHDFGLRSFGAIAGVLGTVLLCFGGALGPVIGGAIYDSTGSYQWVFILSIVVLLMGGSAAAMAPEPGSPSLATDPG